MRSIDTSLVPSNALVAHLPAVITARGSIAMIAVTIGCLALAALRVLGRLMHEAASALAQLAATGARIVTVGALAVFVAVALLFGGWPGAG